MWPEVRHGKLANGLSYYVLRNHKPEKRAYMWLAVNAGSVQEDDDQRGLAHFCEHMEFNGTKRFPKQAIVNLIEKMGMRFGADLNAYTSWDETVYQLEVPTDKPEFMNQGFDILHEWAGSATFDPVEVDKERGVVLEEWRLGLGAGRRLFDKHVKVLFAGSRYADRVVIGLADTLRKAPRDTLYRYYKDWYRPDLMAVLVVGDIDDPAAIEQQIKARFGDLKNPASERPRPRGIVPPASGTRISIETDREQTTQVISVLNQLPHRSEANRADFRRILMEGLYGQIFNARMRTLARDKDAAFMGAGAGFQGETREIDVFSRSATVKRGRVDDALRALFTEALRIEQHGFTQSELDRARTVVKRNYEQYVADAPTAPSRPRMQELLRNFFEREFVIGPKAERDLALQMLPGITLADLNQLAKTAGGASNRVILYSGPVDKPAPTKARLQAIIDEVGKQRLEPWVDKAPPSELMTQLPEPGTIVAETHDAKLGTTEWKLSNGARVIVKPTDFAADNVLLAGSSPGGLAMASNPRYNDARFADLIAAIGGVGNLDTEDLNKVLAGKELRVSTSINATTDSVRANASGRDLETMFQLLHLKISAPRKDDDAIAVWKANYAERLTNQTKSPGYQFSVESRKLLWKNHLRSRTPTPADIEKVDPDKALAFYRERFANLGDFTFTIVGSVDLAKLKPLVARYLASLPGKAKWRGERERDVGMRRIGGVVKRSWRFGQEPKASVSILFHGPQRWTRNDERDMYILGRALGIRLREVMREDMGGVYGVGVGGDISRRPRQERVFSIRFGADPGRVDELVEAAYAEIDKVKKTGISDDILDKLRKGFRRTREQQLKSNGFWLGWLAEAARFGDDPDLILDPEPMIARMTNANTRAAARRFLGRRNVYTSILLPANTAGAEKP